jgi:ABC-2 type transport system permease protein
MSVATAFLKRDVSMALSYRMSFVLRIFGIFFSVASFYFLSRLFGGAMVSQLDQYGGDYFSFVLIGLAFISPTRLSTILLSSSLWSYLQTTINVIIYLIIGALVFGFNVSQANFITAIVVLILSIVSFSGFGILSAAVVLVIKQGDPISWLFGSFSTLLAGVYYPISVLPGWLTPLSHALPMTYALDAMRLAMLKGASLYDVRLDVMVLLGFSVVLTPIAFYAFKLALKRAKIEGSLIQY